MLTTRAPLRVPLLLRPGSQRLKRLGNARYLQASSPALAELLPAVWTGDLSAAVGPAKAHPGSPVYELAEQLVALPCSVMNCGDVYHQSTLDAILRGETQGVSNLVFIFFALLAGYLSLTPGPAAGFIDTYFAAPVARKAQRKYSKADVILGRELGVGAFGVVYRASLRSEGPPGVGAVVAKKASEFGEAEVWMNERMARASPSVVADYLGTYLESPGKPGSEIWLLWRYEGQLTLADAIGKSDFPYNLAPLLCPEEESGPKSLAARARIVKLVLRQILGGLVAMHATGLVHRDIKPQNLVVSESANRIKLIDLGATCDLRIGKNYAPTEFVLDPRYAAPEQYIMQKSTAAPPPPPVAAVLSPVLWQLNRPDRFDVYSTGVIFMQMTFRNLQGDDALEAFNADLAACNYRLTLWREGQAAAGRTNRALGRDLAEGFELLDADGGAGWALAQRMLSRTASERLSAAEALASPFLTGARAGRGLPLGAGQMSREGQEGVDWLLDRMAKSGTAEGGGFTEAGLEDMGMKDEQMPLESFARRTIAKIRRNLEGPSLDDESTEANSNGAGRAALRRDDGYGAPDPSSTAVLKREPDAPARARNGPQALPRDRASLEEQAKGFLSGLFGQK